MLLRNRWVFFGFFFQIEINYHSWREYHTHLVGFLKYNITEKFSRAGEFCFHRQMMNSSCLYTCLVQMTNNNKTTKKTSKTNTKKPTTKMNEHEQK